MSDDSSINLRLPYLAAAQAQKHVTHNEALRRLDAMVQLTVLGPATAPPEEPAEGDRHLIAATATGAFAAREGQVAAWLDGAWEYFVPQPGWLLFDQDGETLLLFQDGEWQPANTFAGALGPLDMLGVNATADETNRFAVRSEAVLFAAVEAGSGGTGDIRFTVNKEGAGDSATLLFQSGWSGRAEIGLAGDDDLVLKVSPDGSAWTEAVRIDKDTGLAAIGYDNAASGLAATTVQGALDELADEKADAAALAAVALSGAYGDLSGLPTLGALAAADEVGNAELADMAAARLKGRAAGAGTGAPQDLTAAEATALLDAMAGDVGSGGAKGLVPAPTAGDAAANKVLGADGAWRPPLRLLQADEFTASGTWSKDDRAVLVLVQVVGGGGGGASGGSGDSSANRAGAEGGGAGGVSQDWFMAGQLGSAESVTVGAAANGGAGVTGGSGGSNGSAGNASSFGIHLAARGGLRGAAGSGLGGPGTAVSVTIRSTAGSAATTVLPGDAGDRTTGGGNGNDATRGGTPWLAAGPGGGGGGAGNSTAGGTGTGGAGGGGHGASGEGLLQAAGSPFGGGGTGGAGGASPAAGATPVDAPSPGFGAGGGGGGSTVTASVNGGAGGDGAAPGGGGGGGGACRDGTSGAGGKGARGTVRVWQYG